MGFIYKKNGNPSGGRVLMEYTLTDSSTYTIGDAMALASGALDLVGAGAAVAGILVDIKKADGSPVTDDGAGGGFTDTYTTPASNTVVGTIDIALDSIYSVTADATLGTTTGSDLAGYNMDVVAASDQLDESTSLTTTGQFFSYGIDPDGTAASNSVLVSIQESQIKI
jgi:hypothetical protein